MSADEGPTHLRVVRGELSAEEIAALVAVLAAAVPGAAEEEPAPPPPASAWASPERLRRQALAPTGWWASSLPG